MICKIPRKLQEDHLSQNDWRLEGIRKRLLKEEMVEPSLKGLVRINQVEKCASKGKQYCKNKYIHGESDIFEKPHYGYCSGV